MLSAGRLVVSEVHAQPCVTKPLCTPEATIAVCLGGTPRTFKYDAVQRSLLQNVLTSFGGVNVTAFAYIKLEDSWGNARNDVKLGVHVHSEDEISRMLRRLGVRKSRTVPKGADTELAGLQARAPCPGYPSIDSFAKGRSVKDDRANGLSIYKSLLGQLRNRKGCCNLIEADERSHSRRFRWVMFTRPDLLWYAPLGTSLCHLFASPRPNYFYSRMDWSLLLRREQMAAVLSDPFDDFHGCRAPYLPDINIDVYVKRSWNRAANLTVHEGFALPTALIREASKHPSEGCVSLARCVPPSLRNISALCTKGSKQAQRSCAFLGQPGSVVSALRCLPEARVVRTQLTE
jgi:hypothetical protein